MSTNLNKRVVLIHQNPEYSTLHTSFPPIGTLGTVVSELDDHKEFDVEFDNHPCPVGGETSWVTHISMVVFIDDMQSKKIQVEHFGEYTIKYLTH